jgi:hypothetical protein
MVSAPPKPNAKNGATALTKLPGPQLGKPGERVYQAGRRCWGMSPRRSWSLADVAWAPEPGDEIVRLYPGSTGTLARWTCTRSGHWALRMVRSATYRPDASVWRPALQVMGLWETFALLPEQQLRLIP